MFWYGNKIKENNKNGHQLRTLHFIAYIFFNIVFMKQCYIKIENFWWIFRESQDTLDCDNDSLKDPSCFAWSYTTDCPWKFILFKAVVSLCVLHERTFVHRLTKTRIVFKFAMCKIARAKNFYVTFVMQIETN